MRLIKLLRPLGWTILKSSGWRVENRIGDVKKCVIIAAPHTSNWDMPYTLSVASALDLDFYWLGKHTLWEGKWGWFFDGMGGIPVDRRKRGNYVETIADFIESHDNIALAVAPEGTRSKVDFWKSGFYHIAKMANVPIVLGFLDFNNKVGGLGHKIWPIGTQQEVADELRAFYTEEMALRPELFTMPRLRGEQTSDEEE